MVKSGRGSTEGNAGISSTISCKHKQVSPRPSSSKFVRWCKRTEKTQLYEDQIEATQAFKDKEYQPKRRRPPGRAAYFSGSCSRRSSPSEMSCCSASGSWCGTSFSRRSSRHHRRRQARRRPRLRLKQGWQAGRPRARASQLCIYAFGRPAAYMLTRAYSVS